MEGIFHAFNYLIHISFSTKFGLIKKGKQTILHLTIFSMTNDDWCSKADEEEGTKERH